MVGRESPALILDNGSGFCKAGFAGESTPRAIFPAVVGWPKAPGTQAGMELSTRRGMVGDEAQARERVLNLKRPLEHGVVTSWEDMERVWRHAYAELGATASEHPVLVTEAPLNPKANREQMVQLLFEDFGAPAVHVAVSGVVALYATGSRTGLVVESGDGVSTVVPIYDDYVVPFAVQRLDLGGRDLTEYLARLLREERGYAFHTAAERRAAWEVKEQLCYVAENYTAELRAAAENPEQQERSYALPDGSAIVAAGSERFRCPEALFQPSLVGKEVPGLHTMAFESITKCDVDVQRALAANVILSGGSVTFPGMRERMLKELSGLMPPTTPTKVVMPNEPRYAAFVGGSILASLSDFQQNWITRKDYEEFGLSVIQSRSLCFTEAGAQGLNRRGRGGGC